ncbi:MAG: hypothetical protein CL993_01540 [Euryarchaeota archaeon]|nr:hypothetical protein [Euryarchaeota archaeon]
MDELPRGLKLKRADVMEPRSSASAVFSRNIGDKYEILMCHRVPELPSFPDLWSFPGGGVSRVDYSAAEDLDIYFLEHGINRVAIFTLLREIVEEVGISPDGNGGFIEVDAEVRNKVCENKEEWLNMVQTENLSISNFHCQIISDRITPPNSTLRFHNLFFHIPMGDSKIEPRFPEGRSEFDEFKWWDPIDLLHSWEANELRIPPPIITLIRDLVDGINNQGSLIEVCNNLALNPPNGRHKFEYAPGVECILIPTNTLPPSTHTNCFILGHPGGERIIIDPAINDEEGFKELKLKVEEIEAEDSTIIATLFTHKHRDHIGDLRLISNLYSAPIWATEITLNSLFGEYEKLVLKDRDTINIEGPKGTETWEIMETPGHCPGQICLVSDLGIISADNCSANGTILVPSEDGDMDEYIRGLERIKEMEPGILFPGHGPFIINPRKLLDRYISHRKKRHQLVIQAVEEGKNKLSEISKFTYSDTPNAHPILSEDQTKSHLKSWIKSGRIIIIDDEYKINKT